MQHLVWWVSMNGIEEVLKHLSREDVIVPPYILVSLDLLQSFYDEADEDIGGAILQDIGEFGQQYVAEHEDMITKDLHLPDDLSDRYAGITIHALDFIYAPEQYGFITSFGLQTVLPHNTKLL